VFGANAENVLANLFFTISVIKCYFHVLEMPVQPCTGLYGPVWACIFSEEQHPDIKISKKRTLLKDIEKQAFSDIFSNI
jgi:hypothetical protein